MSVLIWLIPVALTMGALGLVGFLWSLRSGQFDDMDGAAQRILMDDDEPLPGHAKPGQAKPVQAKPGQAEPGQGKSGNIKLGQSKPGEG